MSNIINKIVVCIDLSKMDPELIRLAAFLAEDLKVEKVSFLNVVKSLQLPDELKKVFPNLINNAIRERKVELEENVKRHFDTSYEVDLEYVVESGTASKKIIEFAEKNNIDLIIVGRKSHIESSGTVNHRIARRAHCSLLIVPEDSVGDRTLRKLLVPVDFSQYSLFALNQAVEIAENYGKPVDIISLYVYTVPSGYHYSGKSYEEFAEIMRKNAEKDYERFIKKLDSKNQRISPLFVLDKDDKPADKIIKTAKDEGADGIIMGSIGKSATYNLLIGSNAEKLIQINREVPLLIIRPKGKEAGLRAAIEDI